jgi:hypothetical protein
MKYFLSLFLICGLLMGAGCGKKQNQETAQQASGSTDCASAENTFACFLDKATHAKNPNLCNDAGSKRMICYTAYAEILEKNHQLRFDRRSNFPN